MSLIHLPELRADLQGLSFDLRPGAVERWEPGLQAAASDDATVSIYEPIGQQWDGEGFTAKRMSAALRAIGDRDVVVNINSPGGSFFEGVTIYNMLRTHKARVTVNVLGLAASAASIIAMAGDEVRIGDGAFLMIHNCCAVAIGNRHDMRAAAEQMEPFDEAMADVYAKRSGLPVEEVAAMMDAETWLGATDAVEKGLATGPLEATTVTHAQAHASKPLAQVEALMARAGCTRAQRRDLLKALFEGKPSAATGAMPSAGVEASLKALLTTLKGNE